MEIKYHTPLKPAQKKKKKKLRGWSQHVIKVN